MTRHGALPSLAYYTAHIFTERWTPRRDHNKSGSTNQTATDGEGRRRRAYVTGSTHAHAPPSCHARMRKERESKPSGTKVTSAREKVAGGGHPDLHGHRFPRPEGKTGNEAFFRRRPLRPTLPALPQWLVNVSDDRAIIYFDTQNSTTAISFIANGTKESAAN